LGVAVSAANQRRVRIKTMTVTEAMKRQQTAIERGKASRTMAEQWKAQAEEFAGRPNYLRLSAMELIELAERPRLMAEELEALDEAWFAKFGETLTFPRIDPANSAPDQ
jgi:ketol-acid reductoisomerase